MNRSEALQLQSEEPARALFKAGVETLAPEALDPVIARKTAAHDWLKRRAGFLSSLALLPPVLLAGAAFALHFWGGVEWPRLDIPTNDPVARAIVYAMVGFGVGVVVSVLLIFVSMLYEPAHDPDLAFAERLRADLAGEDESVRAICADAENGVRFALYLRTFATENEVSTTQAARAREAPKIAAAYGPSVSPDVVGVADRALAREMRKEILAVRGEWEQHLAILEAVGKFAPVVCLGNLFLPDDKREDLRRRNVREVTLLKQDWWPVFTGLERRAAATVMLASADSPSVERELDHLAGAGRPFVIVSSSEHDARLRNTEAYTRALRSPQVRHVVFDGVNVAAPLEKALRSLPVKA